ncbi:MAG: bifunctional metallophosphatase/5'-nucleotidase [Desulfomonilaceae bacterium]
MGRSLALKITACILVFIGFCVAQLAVAAPQELVILFMNDPHAHYEPYEIKGLAGLSGGFAKAQTVLRQQRSLARRQGKHSIALMAGDLLMGTPFSTYFKGELGARLLNEMRFAAMAVGNHEFDYGVTNLMESIKGNLAMPLLSANIVNRNGGYPFQRTAVLQLPGFDSKIVLIGLTTDQTPITTLPSHVAGLKFEDPIATACALLKDADPNDLVIALTHLGVDQDKKLALACPVIDVIVGGHSHTALFQPLVENGVIICQAGAYAEYVGKLTIAVDHGKVTRCHGELIRLTADIPDDETISSIIKTYREKLDKSLKRVIGKTEVFLEGGRSAVRSDRPTNLGQLIAYIMMTNTGSEAALINGGAIRASIPPGEITKEMVDTAFPFSNTVARVDLTGDDLAHIIRQSYALPPNSGGKLQFYGIELVATPTGPAISKIGRRPFNPQAEYTVAVTDFLAQGGDGYFILRDDRKNVVNSGLLVNDLLTEFIETRKVISQDVLDGILRAESN